jgi:Ca2+-binding RTX toxin-like protein
MSVNIKFATDNSEYAWIGVTTPVPNTIRDKLPVHLTTDPKWIESHIALVNGMTNIWANQPLQGYANQTLADKILSQWENVVNIKNLNLNVTVAYTTGIGENSGVTVIGGGSSLYQTPSGIFINPIKERVVFLNPTYASNLSLGQWDAWTFMHELGHVLDIKHNTEPATLSLDFRISIMDYPTNRALAKVPLTPGMQDIAYLQNGHDYGILNNVITSYGESHSQDGDTAFKFTKQTVDLGHGNIIAGIVDPDIKNYVMTLWDRKMTATDHDGGIDTIDASGMTTNVYIDLRANHFSSIGSNINIAPTGADINADGDPDGNTDYNVGIAFNAEIENAKGGSGNDYLKGNDLRNELTGNAGDDTLEGGLGNDLLKGGAGLDIYKFSTANGVYGVDTIKDDDNNGRIEINGQILYGTDQTFGNIYKGTTSNYTYIKVNNGDLLVLNENNFANLILIQNWSNNGLNINLVDQTATAPTTTLAGDFTKKINGNGTATTADDFYEINNDFNYLKDLNNPVQVGALDLINGTPSDDVIDGKGGSDALIGKAGNDYIIGGTEGDYILGGAGKDTLIGGDGDDKLYGTQDGSFLSPTSPNETPPVNTFEFKQGSGFSWISGYNTIDLFSNGTPSGYTIGLIRPPLVIETDSNQIDGGAGNDFIAAGTAADYVHGGADKDEIWGMGGADILFGDAGNDVIYGDGNSPNDVNGGSVVWAYKETHGNDIIDGGDGDDIIFGQGKDDIIFGGIGDDLIWGDDPLYYTDEIGNDILFGGAGVDQLVGGKGNDYLEGGENNDKLFGDDDNDTIIGGTGSDTLVGGLGADLVYFNIKDNDRLGGTQEKEDIIVLDINANDVQDATAKTDPLGHLTGGVDINLGLGVSATIDNGLVGSSDYSYTFADGSQILHSDLMGTKLNSVINNSSTDLAIFGGKLNDYLIASAANGATVFGGLGNDYLSSPQGGNTLIGGKGQDTLVGGSSNTYQFKVGDGTDYVYRTAAFAATDNDKIKFTDVKSTDNYSLEIDQYHHLVLKYGINDVIYISNVFTINGPIKTFQFSNGVTWTLQELLTNNLLNFAADINEVSLFNNVNVIGGDNRVDFQVNVNGDIRNNQV